MESVIENILYLELESYLAPSFFPVLSFRLNPLLNPFSSYYFLTFILQEISDSCLTLSHLSTLMEGLRGYLPELNKESLEAAIAKLKDELDYDGAKINHLHLALYNFQVDRHLHVMRPFQITLPTCQYFFAFECLKHRSFWLHADKPLLDVGIR